jgi:serine/threonine-protein kinase
MVGAFGEVQVMDWGLAKVLSDAPDTNRTPDNDVAERTVIETIRTGDTDQHSRAGSIFGTYAYMPPEQARGDVDALDRRADVFGLGAILCEILTGRPPYVGPTVEDLRRQARQANLESAFARLDGSQADEELTSLAKACMAENPEKRPADAGVLAAAVGGYLSEVQERLRLAEVARAQAETKAVEERKRRRVLLALAAAVLLLVTGGGSGAWLWSKQLSQTEQQANRALNDAWRFHDQGKYREAADAANQAVAVVEAGPVSSGFKQSVLNQAQDLKDRAEAVERRGRFLDLLVGVRSAKENESISSPGDETHASYSVGRYDIDGEYVKIFQAYGADVDSMEAEDAANVFHNWSEDERIQLAAALDDWALERWRWSRPANEWRRILALARLVDPDPLRSELRAMFGPVVKEDQLERLRDLARPSFVVTLRPATASLVARELWQAGAKGEAEQALRAAQLRYPNDMWLNYELGEIAHARRRYEEAVRFYSAARALRPEIGHYLAHALEESGHLEEAGAVFKELIRIYPDNPNNHSCFGDLLAKLNQPKEAEAEFRLAIAKQYEFFPAHVRLAVFLSEQHRFEEAESAFREAIRIRPDFYPAHYDLGVYFMKRGRSNEAEDELRESIRLRSSDAPSHLNLGVLLEERKKHEEAETEFRTAIRLAPDLAAAHHNLGLLLAQHGKPDEAESEFRWLIEHEALGNLGRLDLGKLRSEQGKHAEAETEYRLVVEADPANARAHSALGALLYEQSKGVEADLEAERHLRLAIKYDPSLPSAHDNLGLVLRRKGKRADAEAEFRLAIKINPEFGSARTNLGTLLAENGKWQEAEDCLRQAIKDQPDYHFAHYNLGLVLAHRGKSADAEDEFRLAIQHKPTFAPAHTNLGAMLQMRGKSKEAREEFETAIRHDRKYVPAHYNLALLLGEQGESEAAVREFREVIKLQPLDYEAHYNLANQLMKDSRKLSDAEAEFRKAIEINPNYAEAHCNLGSVLRDQGKLVESLAEYRRGADLGSLIPNWPYPSKQWVEQAERWVELDKKLPAVLRHDVQSRDVAERIDLARLCQYYKHSYGSAAQLYADAFVSEPKLVDDPSRAFRYDAACCAVLAADGEGADASRLDDKDQVRLRKQACAWLQADLDIWKKVKRQGKANQVTILRQALQHWQDDPDLASLREAKALDKLPDAERDAWKTLWADVETLLK